MILAAAYAPGNPGRPVPHPMIMDPGSWIALAAICLTCLTALAGVGYQLGQITTRQQDVIRRIQRIEDKLDRVPKRRARGDVD